MRKSGNTEAFLSAYRMYEGLLRDRGTDYKQLEESADDLEANRMRMSRQMRNYLSHTDDPGFLEISDQQLFWLEKKVREEQQKGDLVRDHLWTPKKALLEEGMPVSEALAKFVATKQLVLPIASKTTVLGSVSILNLTKLSLKDPASLLDRKSYGAWGQVCLVPGDLPVPKLDQSEPCICCTVDGTPTGKRLGVWKR